MRKTNEIACRPAGAMSGSRFLKSVNRPMPEQIVHSPTKGTLIIARCTSCIAVRAMGISIFVLVLQCRGHFPATNNYFILFIIVFDFRVNIIIIYL